MWANTTMTNKQKRIVRMKFTRPPAAGRIAPGALLRPLACFVLCLALALSLAVPASAVIFNMDFETDAQGVYLYNMDTETLVSEKNMDKAMYPASLTKSMTCILALEYVEEKGSTLDTEIAVYPAYVQDYLYDYQWVQGNGAVSLGGDLRPGEEFTMRQMLYALMLPSANEIAMIIADHIGGSQEAFAELMNKRARELGCQNTNFVNPNGLFDENHITTPHDIAIMSIHALTLEGFEEIVSATYYDSGPTNLRDNVTWDTTIKMQVPGHDLYYSGLKGIKTGSVPQAGDCFVSTCTRDGFTYLLVVMGSKYLDETGAPLPQRGAFVDTKRIYDWVFDNFKRKTLVDKGTHVGEIPLKLSLERDHIKLMTGERFTYLVPVSTEISDVTQVAEIPDSINAPVKKNDEIGELRLILGGEEIGRVTLLAAESVEASPMLVLWERIKEIMSSFWFKFIVILIVLLILFYIFIMIMRNRGRRRGYKPRRRI